MSIRPQDVLLYAGGECIQRFGVPVWRMARSQDQAETASRTGSVGPVVGKDGVLRQASADLPRIDWVDTDGDGVLDTPSILAEIDARENLVLQSEDLSTTWSNIGSPVLGTPHTASGVSLDLLEDNAGGAAEGKSQAVSFTGDGFKTVSVHWKAGVSPTPGGDEIVLRDTTAGADRLLARISDAGDGSPSIVLTTGQLSRAEPRADGVWRLLFTTNSVTAANTNEIHLYAGRRGTVADTGDVYWGGVQAEDAIAASSYIATTTSTVTRNADTGIDLPIGFGPQGLTLYVKFGDIGMARREGANAGDVVSVGLQSGGGSAGEGYIQIDNGSGGDDYEVKTVAGSGATTASVDIGDGNDFSAGDLVEVSAQIDSDFGIAGGAYRIDGGSETALGTASNSEGMPTSWVADYVRIHSERILAVKVVTGARSLSDMAALFAYDPVRAVA